MDWLRIRKLEAEATERSFLQWTLIRALAFGERDWILLCALMFLVDGQRAFLTVPGIAGFTLGVVFLGPVFGMLIYFTSKLIYLHLKSARRLPVTAGGLKLITWTANGFCFPLIFFVSWEMFRLYYETYDSLMAFTSPAS